MVIIRREVSKRQLLHVDLLENGPACVYSGCKDHQLSPQCAGLRAYLLYLIVLCFAALSPHVSGVWAPRLLGQVHRRAFQLVSSSPFSSNTPPLRPRNRAVTKRDAARCQCIVPMESAISPSGHSDDDIQRFWSPEDGRLVPLCLQSLEKSDDLPSPHHGCAVGSLPLSSPHFSAFHIGS